MIDDESESETDDGGRATVVGVAFDWGEGWQAQDEQGVEPNVLRFEVGGMALAAPVAAVAEVAPAVAITPLPGLPPHVLGVAVRRRHVLSIVDLTILFDLPNGRPAADTRLLVLEADGLEAGVIAPATSGLEVWPEAADSPGVDDLSPTLRRCVVGARWAPGGRMLLLDVAELLRIAAVR